MLITIVTNTCGEDNDNIFVQAVEGALTDDQKVKLARAIMKSSLGEQNEYGESEETVSFTVVELSDNFDFMDIAGRMQGLTGLQPDTFHSEDLKPEPEDTSGYHTQEF